MQRLLLRFTKISKLPDWLLLLVTLSPALAYVLYMYVFIPFYDIFGEWFEFFSDYVKSLTSRVRIWSAFDADLLTCLLIGKYENYYSGQWNNSLATLYGRFGLLFVIIVCRKFYQSLKKMNSSEKQLPLCAAWIIGCFETAFFTGMGGIFLMLLLMPLVGTYNND